MARRGRPRHPDILTPREWDVLALLREGLTNEQIAARLEITERTAKFHVSEILSKLGVGSREEAAAWSASGGEERRPWWLAAMAPLAYVWRKSSGGLNALGLAAGAGMLVAVAAGIALLAVMLVGRAGGDGGTPALASGERIAFSFQGSIYVVRPDGSDLSSNLQASAGVAYSAPEFSPDSHSVAYIVDRKRVVVATADFQSVLADVSLFLDRTPPTPIASDSSMGPTAVHWSPDGALLLVTRQRLGGSGVADVVVMNAEGSDPQPVIESGFFIEATWFEQLAPPSGPAVPRILVAGYERAIDARLFDLAGNDIGPGVPQGSAFYAVASHAEPGGERVLVAPALGSPEPFGPIVLQGTGEPAIIAGGCGATWSPDGSEIAYYDGFGIAIKTPDAAPGDRQLIVTNEQLGLPSSTQANTGACGNLGADVVGISWTGPAFKTYRDDTLGIELEYPGAWTEGAAPSPYVSCFGCVVFGPRYAAWPHGVELFTQDVDLAGPQCGGELGGCPVTAFVGNRALPQGDELELEVAGGAAWQQEIERQAPLGLVDETGDSTPYREVWTAVPAGKRALFIVAFWRDGDEPAKQETLAAYGVLLKSLVIR